MFFKKKWDPKGLHIYLTGGSEGLGLVTAISLAKRGANISIVSRSQVKLDKALEQIEAARQNPSQIFKAHSFSLSTAEESEKALQAVCEPYDGRAPDAVFACAGSSKPMFFVEMTADDLSQGMDNAYWLQAWTAFAAGKMMARQRKKGGKIVFVSSILGYMTFVGWSSYSPAKHAIRALADSLESEFLLYGIDIHVFIAQAMITPGYDNENRTKPAITKRLESGDELVPPEKAAAALIRGVEKGQTHIAGNLVADLFRASTRGSTLRNNWFLDAIYDMIAFVAIPIWRHAIADKEILKHRKEHFEYLEQKGFFEQPTDAASTK